MSRIRLREACKRPDVPSYNTCVRMSQRGELQLYQIAGRGPLFVDEADLDALWQPVERTVTTPESRPTGAVPQRPRDAA